VLRGRIFLALLLLPCGASTAVEWRSLAPGLELAEIATRVPSHAGDSRITVIRADPAHWELALVGADASGDGRPQTARAWARGHGLQVATNAGMFATDHRTHLNAYQSLAAFDPRDPAGGSAPFRIYDLDAPGVTVESIRRDYASLVQNLRLIRKPGTNRWSQQPKRWSEAAFGEDAAGRPLFIHCRSPFSMHDLNRELLAAGIDLVAAKHLEGGPEAQLYVEVGATVIELVGSFETDFREDEGNTVAWPVPHVLGLRPRK
jgi:hypothetical protein